MIPFTITDDDIRRAEARTWPREGESRLDNLIGALGEYAVYDWINQWSPCYFSDEGCSYDLLLGDARTIEVKTQKTTVMPRLNYKVNVSSRQWQTKSKIDLWVFVRVHASLSDGWIVAACGKDKRDIFTSHAKGDLMDNGNRYLIDTMDCPISELDDPARMIIHA